MLVLNYVEMVNFNNISITLFIQDCLENIDAVPSYNFVSYILMLFVIQRSLLSLMENLTVQSYDQCCFNYGAECWTIKG